MAAHHGSKCNTEGEELEAQALHLDVGTRDNPSPPRVVIAADEHNHGRVRRERRLPQQVLTNWVLEAAQGQRNCKAPIYIRPLVDSPSPHDAQHEVHKMVHVDSEIVSGEAPYVWMVLARESEAKSLVKGEPALLSARVRQLRCDVPKNLAFPVSIKKLLTMAAEQWGGDFPLHGASRTW